MTNPTRRSRQDLASADLFAGLEGPVEFSRATPHRPEFWIETIRRLLAERSPDVLKSAEEALRICPSDPELLLLATLSALAVDEPVRTLALLKRYGKRFVAGKTVALLTALALAQQGKFISASALLEAEGLSTDAVALSWFVGDDVMEDWLLGQLRRIRLERRRAEKKVPVRVGASPASGRKTARAPGRPPKAAAPAARVSGRPAAPPPVASPPIADLPKLEARFDLTFDLANAAAIEITGPDADPESFDLRSELVRLSLFEGFITARAWPIWPIG